MPLGRNQVFLASREIAFPDVTSRDILQSPTVGGEQRALGNEPHVLRDIDDAGEIPKEVCPSIYNRFGRSVVSLSSKHNAARITFRPSHVFHALDVFRVQGPPSHQHIR